MTPRRIHELAASAAGRPCSEAEINRWLTAQGISDPETRIAIKHQMAAQGLATDDQPPLGTMRTDTTAPRADVLLSPEMRVLLRKSRIDPSRSYSQAELNDLLDRSGLDVESRLAIKVQLADMGQQRASARATVQAGRDMTAAAERPRGKVLLDKSGKPAVLRSQPV